MTSERTEKHASYKSTPHQNRFWLSSETCYTEQELAFREWVIKVRANSGIHSDFLNNPSSWFADTNQALININENTWFFANSYKPRQVLSRDDFHVQPIDSQRLHWPMLYELMQEVGDYLLIRNSKLPENHLNQPINYVLLDINHILKALSQNTDIKQVREQLELVTRYLRSIEKNISPLIGSDRLFLANFREVIDEKINPQLTHKIESQLLKDRLGHLSKTISQLSTDRNRILHFALNTNPVNPHPYDFMIDKSDDAKAYPTQAAKACAQEQRALIVDPLSALQLTRDQLKSCPNFNLITMEEEVLNHYARAVSDLNELARFQKVVGQIMDLLSQAGEVYTIHQFKNQMIELLKQIDHFIADSAQHIDAIVHANTQAYHLAIQTEQNLPIWKQWLSTEQTKLRIYIKNQDTLAQFPSSSSDLAKTNNALREHVSDVIIHLSQTNIKETNFAAIADQAKELNAIMWSMHHWIKIQYEIKGIPAPGAPEPLQLIAAEESPKKTVIMETRTVPSTPLICPVPGPSFFPQTAPLVTPVADHKECSNAINQAASGTHYLYFGLGALSITALVLLLLWSRKGHQAEVLSGDSAEFEQIRIKTEDLIAKIRGDMASRALEDLDDLCDVRDSVREFNRLVSKAQQGIYDLQALIEVHDDLIPFVPEASRIRVDKNDGLRLEI